MKKILFVCLGNICRSPMAEGVFLDLLDKSSLLNAFEVDSAGTGAYHTGELADPRMRDTARKKNINLLSRARKVEVDDFFEFDYILAMDQSNLDNLLMIQPKDSKAKLQLMREYDDVQESLDVPDPYYGGQQGFENVYQILNRSCTNFLNQINQ